MAKSYNPKRVSVSFNGVPLTGFADGTFIEVERNADQFSLMIGADGEGARAASPDKSGTVKLSLLQTSGANDILSALLLTDENTNISYGTFMIKDIMGTTLVISPQMWIKKYANVTFDKEIQAREWTLETDSLELFVGGSLI